jgi:pimeloyl-ACP methyl ester carboxylesterase
MTLPSVRSATINGRTLCWREQGEGVALVLIHGIGGNSVSWEPQFAEFARKYRVIAWDAPGYGGSAPLPKDAPEAADYAKTLAALLDMQGVMAAHVVGQSIGAVIAAALARVIPATAQSLTLLHPLIGFGGMAPVERDKARAGRLAPFESQDMASFAEQRAAAILGPGHSPDLLAQVKRIMSAVTIPAYRQLVEVMASADMMAWAPGLNLPTLVIAGGADKVAPPESCRALANAISGAVYECHDGIGHYMQLEDPKNFRTALDRFLAAHDAAAKAATY